MFTRTVIFKTNVTNVIFRIDICIHYTHTYVYTHLELSGVSARNKVD